MSAFDPHQVHLKERAVSPESRQARGPRRQGPPLKATLGEADVTPTLRRAAAPIRQINTPQILDSPQRNMKYAINVSDRSLTADGLLFVDGNIRICFFIYSHR